VHLPSLPVSLPLSFTVPFEEDLKNPLIWYLDHNYLESMFYMFKKINGMSLPPSFPPSLPRFFTPFLTTPPSLPPSLPPAKERIVGFYSTGPKIKESDLQVGRERGREGGREGGLDGG